MKFKKKLFLNSILSFAMGALVVASPSVSHAKKYKGRLVPGKWEWAWNKHLQEQLFSINGDFFLNYRDEKIIEICPQYDQSERKRKAMWNQLFISLGYKESLHGPENYIKFNGGINKGLFQIDPVLRRAYGCKKNDLYDPEENITCAVKMARRLISKHRTILSDDDGPKTKSANNKGGMSAYWQPLRNTTKDNRKKRTQILSEVQSACAKGIIHYISSNILHRVKIEDLVDEVDLTFNNLEGVADDLRESDYLEYQDNSIKKLNPSVINPFDIFKILGQKPLGKDI